MCAFSKYMLTSWLVVLVVTFQAALSQRRASIHEVQPSERDVVHAVWVNGPTISGKVTSRTWPHFGSGASSSSSSVCTTHGDYFTGYDDEGSYCEPADGTLDEESLLVLHSGHVAIVVDAGGLSGSIGGRNMFPKIGSVSGLPAASTAREILDVLPAIVTNISLETTCSESPGSSYFLGASSGHFFQLGLVRQGHAVTQLTLSSLQFEARFFLTPS